MIVPFNPLTTAGKDTPHGLHLDGSTECHCVKLTAALGDSKIANAVIRAERARVYFPCWQCGEAQGCRRCKPERPNACAKCGAYVHREAFCLYATQLPPEYFDRHPAGWRLSYYALHGVPEGKDGLLLYVRVELRNPKVMAMVREIGRSMLLSEDYLDAIDPKNWKPSRDPWLDVPYSARGGMHPDDEVDRQDRRAAAYAKPVTPIRDAIPAPLRQASLRIVPPPVHAIAPPPAPAEEPDPFFDDVPPSEEREPGQEG